MHLDLRIFEEFITLVSIWKQFLPDGDAVLHLDTEDGWSIVIEDPNAVKLRLSWPLLAGMPDVAERMLGGSHNFPVLRILVFFDLPFRQIRVDRQNTPHKDVDRMRYETWVSANSDFPIGRTSEFGLVTDFRAKLSEAQRSVGFRIRFLSDRPEAWFAREVVDQP